MYCISGVFLKSLAFSRTEDRLDERVLSCLSYQSYPLPLLPCDSQRVSCLTFLATQTLSLSEKRVHTTRRQKAVYIKIRVMPRLSILPDFAKSNSLRLHCESAEFYFKMAALALLYPLYTQVNSTIPSGPNL